MEEEIISVASDLNLEILQNIFVILNSIKEYLFIVSCFTVLIFITSMLYTMIFYIPYMKFSNKYCINL